MKKLSLIATLGCLLSVSGVYAQWIYGQASAGSTQKSIIPQMAGIGESSKKGTITVNTDHLAIYIDDLNNDYTPVLDIRGDAIVNFNAAAGADADVKANGIKLVYTITMTSDWKYDSDGDGIEDKEIFRLENCENVPLNDGNECFEATITSTMLASHIKLNVDSDFKLNTREKFDIFKTSLNKANSIFTLTVSEVAQIR